MFDEFWLRGLALKLGQLVITGEDELVPGREQLLLQVLKHALCHDLIAGLTLRTKAHLPVLLGLHLVLLFIDEVNANAHVVINVDLMNLLQFNA